MRLLALVNASRLTNGYPFSRGGYTDLGENLPSVGVVGVAAMRVDMEGLMELTQLSDFPVVGPHTASGEIR